jgi:hypothetical protein
LNKRVEENFFGHRGFVWLWTVIVALLLLALIYRIHQPIGGRNGGTVVGLAYGALATLGIAFLMWYGIRKRHSYAGGSGTLKGWLSAHVWIGVGLALLVPLHSGFHLGWNVHSAPYLLMLATIASGVWGAWAYSSMPSRMEARREGMSLRVCAQKIESIGQSMSALADGKSPAHAELANLLAMQFRPTLFRILFQRPYTLDKDQVSTRLSSLSPKEHDDGLEMVRMAARRLQLCNKMVAEAGAVARMRIWLYLHLPLSFACVAAVIAHVFWELSYRWTVR